MTQIGDKFGNWIIVSESPWMYYWQCECILCHAVLEVRYDSIVRGCGCKSCNKRRYTQQCTEFASLMTYKQFRRLYTRLYSAIQRCSVEPTYLAKGTQVCAEWLDDCNAFVRHAIMLPDWDNSALVMDRIDNNGHYEPGNIRFVTQAVNVNNKLKQYPAVYYKAKRERMQLLVGFEGCIRKAYATGKCTMQELTDLYCVKRQDIRTVLRGHNAI